MAKLTDTALTILSSAAAREGGKVLPLPAGLKAPKAAIRKVLKQLLASEFLAAVPAAREDETWFEDGESGRTTLVITPTGLAAIGVEAGQDGAPVPKGKTKATKPAPARKAPAAAKKTPAAIKPKDRGKTADGTASTPGAKSSAGTTKQNAVLTLLRRKEGATIAQMMAATGWQAHSVRGFLSGTVKTKMKLTITSEKDKSGERRYRIGLAKGGRG